MTKTPRIGVPHLSGSSKNNLSSARRRALNAVEKEIELPQLNWERSGLQAPKASTPRRVPLAGAEILRRYERSSSSKKRPETEPLEQISSATSKALRSRKEFASKVRGSSSLGLESAGDVQKKGFADAAKSRPESAKGAGAMTDASSVAIDSDINNTTKSLSGGAGSGGDTSGGSSDDGWDDDFADGSGDDGYGDDCNGCDNDHWCDDHWHGGYHDHWGWWPNWGWHGGWSITYGSWCGWYGWYGWWRHPYYYRNYGYNPWWGDSYYTPTVVSSTIYTTEVIEIPVVQEVPAPIAGAELGSPADVQSALQRAAVEYLSLGDRAFAEQRYGDAVRHYARAIECSPEDPVLHLVLSDALFATGDYHYAAYCLRRALELEPNLLEVEFDKRSFYGDPSDFDHHILLLEGYLADHVLDDDARLLLGANYLFGGNPDALIALYSDTFGDAIRDSDAGRLLLAAAHRAIAAR